MWSRIAQSDAADSDSEESCMGKRMLQGAAETQSFCGAMWMPSVDLLPPLCRWKCPGEAKSMWFAGNSPGVKLTYCSWLVASKLSSLSCSDTVWAIYMCILKTFLCCLNQLEYILLFVAKSLDNCGDSIILVKVVSSTQKGSVKLEASGIPGKWHQAFYYVCAT